MRAFIYLTWLLSAILVCHSSHGDYVNQFVAHIDGGAEEAASVVEHLVKRSAFVRSTVRVKTKRYVHAFNY